MKVEIGQEFHVKNAQELQRLFSNVYHMSTSRKFNVNGTILLEFSNKNCFCALTARDVDNMLTFTVKSCWSKKNV